jgi:hypothetical protein
MPVTNKMTEVWGTSTLDPANKVIFNWKIENFPRVLRSFGQIGFDSPEFKVTSSDGRVHSLKLRFQQMEVPGGGILDRIDANQDYRVVDDFTLLNVSVVNTNSVKSCLAGSLSISMLDQNLGGETTGCSNPIKRLIITTMTVVMEMGRVSLLDSVWTMPLRL